MEILENVLNLVLAQVAWIAFSNTLDRTGVYSWPTVWNGGIKKFKRFVKINRESGTQEFGQQDNHLPSLAEGQMS